MPTPPPRRYSLPDEVRIALDAAANLIERQGWRQGTDGPGLCALDAIDAACSALGISYLVVNETFREHVTGHARPIHAWNDQDGQTATAVVEAMRELSAPDDRRQRRI